MPTEGYAALCPFPPKLQQLHQGQQAGQEAQQQERVQEYEQAWENRCLACPGSHLFTQTLLTHQLGKVQLPTSPPWPTILPQQASVLGVRGRATGRVLVGLIKWEGRGEWASLAAPVPWRTTVTWNSPGVHWNLRTSKSQRGSRSPEVDSGLACPLWEVVWAGWVFLELDYRPFLIKHEGTGGILWLVSWWSRSSQQRTHPCKDTGSKGKWVGKLVYFYSILPSRSGVFLFYRSPRSNKIRFKNYKALEFWKGVELGYCVCEMITSPTSCISLLSKMDLGRKSIKQQQLSKLLRLIWKSMDSQKGQAPKHYVQCIVLGNQNKHRKKKINSLSATCNVLVSNMCKYL